MAISPYLKNLRKHIGQDPILASGVNAIIRNELGKILLQLRSDNKQWAIPGGTSELGEKPAQTLVREVFEETGLVVKPTCLVGVTQQDKVYPNGDKLSSTSATFECVVLSGELQTDEESLALQFFDVEQISEMLEKHANKLPKEFAVFARAFLLTPRTQGAYFEWDETWLKV